MNTDDIMAPIGIDEVFQFGCHASVPCFNACCRDLNQFLTPYDILRLKDGLGMKAAEFLATYTRQHTGPETGLPVITLKPADSAEMCCPFVTDAGCRVYADRPASCRMYPLARMISRSREDGKITEHYALIREPHCRGFTDGRRQTVREWLVAQGLIVYNEMNDLMMEIISLKNKMKPGPLDVKSAHLFYTACYDLDRFRSNVASQGLMADMQLPESEKKRCMEDDEALLRFGLTWVRRQLFGV